MTHARPLCLLAAALALPLLLAGCVSPSVDPDESPSEGVVSTAVAPTEVGEPSDGASFADLSEFPGQFPLPTRTPIFVDRVNYEWQIDYRFDGDEEPVERAEWFGTNDYQAVDVAEKVVLAAGANARTWAWESDEFRVDLVLTPEGDGYVFRYVVLWK